MFAFLDALGGQLRGLAIDPDTYDRVHLTDEGARVLAALEQPAGDEHPPATDTAYYGTEA